MTAIIAGAGRLLALDRYPGGLAEAEASHAELARQSGNFGLSWLIEGAGSHSPVLAAMITAVGSASEFDATAPRIAAALCGMGSVLFTGLWLRRAMGPIWGLAGAAVLAGSFWHLLFSRLALSPLAGVLTFALTLWFLAEATSRRDRAALPWYVLTGIAAGLGFLSDPVLRILPLVLLIILAGAMARWLRQRHDRLPLGWLLASIAALLLIGPYVLSHVDDPRLLTPWTPTPGMPGDTTALLDLPEGVITSFTTLFLPDEVERGLNLPDFPYFSILLIPWAAIGLFGLLGASNDPGQRDRFLVGGLGVVALWISVAAVDAGHPGRLVPISPILAGLVVYGFRTAIQWAQVRTVRVALILLVIVGIAGNAPGSTVRYVDEWADEPATRATLNTGVVAALGAVDQLAGDEPIFIDTTGREDLLDYFVTTARRHTFDGHRVLPIPAEENGFALIPEGVPLNPQLETLLGGLPELNLSRDSEHYQAYRLDDRVRQQLPLSVPTIPFDSGHVFYGNQLVATNDEQATVLIAWRSPAESPAHVVDVRLRTTIETEVVRETTFRLPENPLTSALFQVLAIDIEIPATGVDTDLEVRLRTTRDEVVSTPEITDEGYLFLNRYVFEEDG